MNPTTFVQRSKTARVCRMCYREFFPFRNSPGLFCSKKCSRAAQLAQRPPAEKIVVRCRACEKQFAVHPYRIAHGVAYCSYRCRGLMRRLPIGTERVMQKMGGVRQIYVKVAHHRGFWRSWKRKAVIVIEQMIGHKPTRSERRAIRFIGDPLDCNVVLPDVLEMATCSECRLIKVVRTCHARNRRLCLTCFRRVHLARMRVAVRNRWINLSEQDVAAVRLLLILIPKIRRHPAARWFCLSAAALSNIRCGKTWKGIEPMARRELWRTLMERHDKICAKSGATLYDRVTLLRQVNEEKDFHEAMRKDGKNPSEVLDSKVRDTCANISQLFQILKLFPRREQWVSGNLAEMKLRAMEILVGRKNGSE